MITRMATEEWLLLITFMQAVIGVWLLSVSAAFTLITPWLNRKMAALTALLLTLIAILSVMLNKPS